MVSQYVCVMKDLSKSNVSGKRILKEIGLSFLSGAKIGVIGHNGAGKSTLLKLMAGIDKEYSGEMFVSDGTKVGYLAQEPELDKSKNVFENIMHGLHERKKLIDEYNRISAKFTEDLTDDEMSQLVEAQGLLCSQIDAVNAWDIEREVEIAMKALRCPQKDADVTQISGGEKRRVALCQLLLSAPDLLLLDEPTNHLDAESVSWMESFLKNYKGTVVFITHDRYFLDNIAQWILEIEHGECIPWHSNYSAWLEQKHTQLVQSEKTDTARTKELERELAWIQQSPKGRHAKSKARVKAYQELFNEKAEQNQSGVPRIVIPHGPRLGNVVIDVANLSKNIAGKQLLSNFSFSVPPGGVVGIIGANGVGKTTLFKILMGYDNPDSGTVRIGDTVKLGYVDQSRDHLDDNKTVWEEISEGLEVLELGAVSIKSRAYCAAFNFKGHSQQKKVSQLSGGERNRVHLAKLLKRGANVILLDEPSNDLDVDTLRALEDAILSFAGCVFVISHDRWFLDRIATHIIAFDQVGCATWFEGNYEDYHRYMLEHLGKDTKNPQYKHKKLV